MRQVSFYRKRLSSLTRGLFILLLLNGVVSGILLSVIAGRMDDTALGYAKRYVLFHTGTIRVESDSIYPMLKGLEHLHSSPDIPVYSKVFFEDHIKFQYPPTSLLLIELVDAIPGIQSWEFRWMVNELGWFAVLLTGLIVATLLYKSSLPVTGGRSFPASRVDILTLYIVVLLITITFYPITRSFILGQIQTAKTLFAAGALLAWRYQRKKTAGVLIGLICAVKPHWGVVLLWGWLRRQWGMAAAGTITIAAILIVSVSLYGLVHHVDYLSVGSYLYQHGEAFFPNQSVNGLMNRLLQNGNILVWNAREYAPFNPLVYALTFASTILILGRALTWKIRSTAPVTVIELAIIMLSVPMASAIAWEHHYGILLPIFAVLVPIAISRRTFGKWTVPYLVVAFFLVSQRLDIFNALAATPLNILQSYQFFGAIMVLAMLYVMSYKAEQVKPAKKERYSEPVKRPVSKRSEHQVKSIHQIKRIGLVTKLTRLFT